MKASPIGLLLIAGTAFAGSATWNLNPTSSDWNTAPNWTPETVPNGPADTATFGDSVTTEVNLSSDIRVNDIVFSTGANAFTISVGNLSLALAAAGITNNSGTQQNLLNHPPQFGLGVISFRGNATAGDQTTITNGNGASTRFYDRSNAGSAVITNQAPVSGEEFAGWTGFADFSSAGNATLINEGHQSGSGGEFGSTGFKDSSSAGNGTFILGGGGASAAYGAVVGFEDKATADYGTFILNGAAVAGADGPVLYFVDRAIGGDAVFTVNDGGIATAGGGELSFAANSSARNATIIVNGGVGDGGECEFGDHASGGTARIELFGNGNLTNYATRLAIGSLEGDGIVNLGTNGLTIGTNNHSTSFSGLIQGGGPLTKIGAGTLNLAGMSLYSGGTTVRRGTLLANNLEMGSATGLGPVLVSAGILGGRGFVAGATTIGTGSGLGAFLAPGAGSRQSTTLTIQSLLTFKSDGTYTYKLNTKKAKADQVISNGVTIEGGAQFDFQAAANKKLTAGTVFRAISNTAATPISGTFANLPDGSTFTSGRNNFQVSYEGGDGNDLTLTVVP